MRINPVWSPERDDILLRGYQTPTPWQDILAAVNALPGPSVTHKGLKNRAATLNLTRLPRKPAAVVKREAEQREAAEIVARAIALFVPERRPAVVAARDPLGPSLEPWAGVKAVTRAISVGRAFSMLSKERYSR